MTETQVRIFIEKDMTDTLISEDALNEFNSIKNELGLECGNQKSKKSSIPYLHLDELTNTCLKVLCPNSSKLEEYRKQIPLEILKHAKQSNSEQYFDYMEVWHNYKDPDPFLVGFVYASEEDRKSKYTWNCDKYLIGRWGAEDMSISELIDLAISIKSEELSLKAQEIKATVLGFMDFIISCPKEFLKSEMKKGNLFHNQGIDVKNIISKKLEL